MGALFDLILFKIYFVTSNFCCISKLFCPGIHCLQMKALKDLGLDVTKGSVSTESAVTQTKFHIMRSWVHATFCVLHFVMLFSLYLK